MFYKSFPSYFSFFSFLSLLSYFSYFSYFLFSNSTSANSLRLSTSIENRTLLPVLVPTKSLSFLNTQNGNFQTKIRVQTLEPINLPELKLFIPLGSVLEGKVQKVQKVYFREKRKKILETDYQSAELVFYRLILPNNYSLKISAFLLEKQVSLKNKFISKISRKELEKNYYWKKKEIFLRPFDFSQKRSKSLKNKFLERKHKFKIVPGDLLYIQVDSVAHS